MSSLSNRASPAPERAEPFGTIGIVGLGLVGNALGDRLRAAGFQTTGYDLKPQARAAFVEAGGQVQDSLPALGAAAPCVILAVFDSQDVATLMDDPAGLLSAGSVRWIIDCSTGDPDASRAVSLRLAERAIAFIEAPLSGSSEQIGQGEATMLLGGDPRAIEDCELVLSALSPQRVVVGGAGMAARAKLATNLVLGLNRAALAEGFAFAESLGLSPEVFLKLVLNTPASSVAARIKGPLMVSGDFTAQSRIRQHLKDVELMIASATAHGLELPLSQVHARLMRAAIESGDGDLDNAAIVRQWRSSRKV